MCNLSHGAHVMTRFRFPLKFHKGPYVKSPYAKCGVMVQFSKCPKGHDEPIHHMGGAMGPILAVLGCINHMESTNEGRKAFGAYQARSNVLNSWEYMANMAHATRKRGHMTQQMAKAKRDRPHDT